MLICVGWINKMVAEVRSLSLLSLQNLLERENDFSRSIALFELLLRHRCIRPAFCSDDPLVLRWSVGFDSGVLTFPFGDGRLATVSLSHLSWCWRRFFTGIFPVSSICGSRCSSALLTLLPKPRLFFPFLGWGLFIFGFSYIFKDDWSLLESWWCMDRLKSIVISSESWIWWAIWLCENWSVDRVFHQFASTDGGSPSRRFSLPEGVSVEFWCVSIDCRAVEHVVDLLDKFPYGFLLWAFGL